MKRFTLTEVNYAAALFFLFLPSCSNQSETPYETNLRVSVVKIVPYNDDCDVTFKIENVGRSRLKMDSIRAQAVNSEGNTLSDLLINVVNIRSGKSVVDTTYAMNVGCGEIAKFESLHADFSNVEPDPNSPYPIE